MCEFIEDKLCQRIRNIGSRIHVSIVLTYDISIASSGPKIKYHHDIYDSIINYNYDGYYVNIKLMDNKKVIWQIFRVWEFYKENMREDWLSPGER